MSHNRQPRRVIVSDDGKGLSRLERLLSSDNDVPNFLKKIGNDKTMISAKDRSKSESDRFTRTTARKKSESSMAATKNDNKTASRTRSDPKPLRDSQKLTSKLKLDADKKIWKGDTSETTKSPPVEKSKGFVRSKTLSQKPASLLKSTTRPARNSLGSLRGELSQKRFMMRTSKRNTSQQQQSPKLQQMLQDNIVFNIVGGLEPSVAQSCIEFNNTPPTSPSTPKDNTPKDNTPKENMPKNTPRNTPKITPKGNAASTVTPVQAINLSVQVHPVEAVKISKTIQIQTPIDIIDVANNRECPGKVQISSAHVKDITERAVGDILADKTYDEGHIKEWCREISNMTRDRLRKLLKNSKKIVVTSYIAARNYSHDNGIHVAVKCVKTVARDECLTVAFETDSFLVWVTLMITSY